MMTSWSGSHLPSRTVSPPPLARKRPPCRSTLGPESSRYLAARSGSVCLISTTTYAATERFYGCGQPTGSGHRSGRGAVSGDRRLPVRGDGVLGGGQVEPARAHEIVQPVLD